MALHVHLHGALATHGDAARAVTTAGRNLLEILRAVGLDGGTYSVLVLNGELVDAQAVPADDDVVDVYPPLCGG